MKKYLYSIIAVVLIASVFACKAQAATCSGTTSVNGLTYGIVLGEDGKCWLDRNIGSTKVASTSINYQAYGSLFQWGRLADGHELITWSSYNSGSGVHGTTAVLSLTSTPLNNSFITSSVSPYDWVTPQIDSLWSGTGGTNNPCPTGFYIPTQTELAALISAAHITNSASAFGSTTLKLIVSGYRFYSNGILGSEGNTGYVWSSTPSTTQAYNLSFDSGSVNALNVSNRGFGLGVRCVSDNSYGGTSVLNTSGQKMLMSSAY